MWFVVLLKKNKKQKNIKNNNNNKKCVKYTKSDITKGLSSQVSNNVNREGNTTECEKNMNKKKFNKAGISRNERTDKINRKQQVPPAILKKLTHGVKLSPSWTLHFLTILREGLVFSFAAEIVTV